MVHPWLTTPWRLVSQSHGAVALYSSPPLIPWFITPRRPSPLCHVLSPFSAYSSLRAFPFSWGCLAALAPRHSPSRPLFPSSHVYTPPGRQEHFGAGPLDPHLSGDRFVRPARVAPFRPPPLSPVLCPVSHLRLFPASRAFPFTWGCCAALATRPSLSRPLFPSSRVYTPPGRQQPFGADPLDRHASEDRFVCLALVAPFPPSPAWVVCVLQDPLGVLLTAPLPPVYAGPSHSWLGPPPGFGAVGGPSPVLAKVPVGGFPAICDWGCC